MSEISRVNKVHRSNSYITELDSHADQYCVGSLALIVLEQSKTVAAGPFLKSLGTVQNVKMVSAAITFDDPHTGHPVVLLIHQAFYFAQMDHILLCLMQLRMNQIVVDKRPKCLAPNHTHISHSLNIGGEFIIPLSL
jgi:hypothetical protein